MLGLHPNTLRKYIGKGIIKENYSRFQAYSPKPAQMMPVEG